MTGSDWPGKPPGGPLVSRSALQVSGVGQSGKPVLESRRANGGSSAAKSRPRQLSSGLRMAIESMVWRGLACDAAAKEAGLSTRALRSALEKPHCLAFLRSQRKTLLAAEGPRTIVTLCELRDQNENRNAAVAASRTILQRLTMIRALPTG